MSKPKHPVRETRSAAKRREAKERKLAQQTKAEPAGTTPVQSSDQVAAQPSQK